MKKNILLILIIFTTLLSTPPGKLSFTTELFGYVDNLEYYSSYREGVLLLGTDMNLFFNYSPTSAIDFSVGAHFKKDFGDEDYYSDIRPYFKSKYQRDAYSLIIGVLENDNRHKLPDAILAEETLFTDGIEEGIQMKWQFPQIEIDLWMSVDELNTPEHREHLDFGLYLENQFRKLTSSAMVYWDHYGGQLYSPENDPVRDNTNGSLALTFTQPLKKERSDIGTTLRFLGSDTKGLGGGYGFSLSPWIMLNGYKTTFSVFKGDNYHTWRGNTMYHTNDIYYYLQIDKTVDVAKNLYLDWGVRLDFVDISPNDYFLHSEHKLWITLTNDFSFTIFENIGTAQ